MFGTERSPLSRSGLPHPLLSGDLSLRFDGESCTVLPEKVRPTISPQFTTSVVDVGALAALLCLRAPVPLRFEPSTRAAAGSLVGPLVLNAEEPSEATVRARLGPRRERPPDAAAVDLVPLPAFVAVVLEAMRGGLSSGDPNSSLRSRFLPPRFKHENFRELGIGQARLKNVNADDSPVMKELIGFERMFDAFPLAMSNSPQIANDKKNATCHQLQPVEGSRANLIHCQRKALT